MLRHQDKITTTRKPLVYHLHSRLHLPDYANSAMQE